MTKYLNNKLKNSINVTIVESIPNMDNKIFVNNRSRSDNKTNDGVYFRHSTRNISKNHQKVENRTLSPSAYSYS